MRALQTHRAVKKELVTRHDVLPLVSHPTEVPNNIRPICFGVRLQLSVPSRGQLVLFFQPEEPGPQKH